MEAELTDIRNQLERNARTLESIDKRLDTITSAVIWCAVLAGVALVKTLFW